MIKRIFVFILLFTTVYLYSQINAFHEGDLIYQISQSEQSKALQLATKSKYVHVGILYKKEGQFFVFEAVQPVQLTELSRWIGRGEDNHYVVKRLKDADKKLTPEAISKMKKIGEKYVGKDYDPYFEWSDERIYCSELVWKIYKQALDIEIGQLQRMKDLYLSDPLVQLSSMNRGPMNNTKYISTNMLTFLMITFFSPDLAVTKSRGAYKNDNRYLADYGYLFSCLARRVA